MIKDFNKIAIISKEKDVTYTELLKRINLYASIIPGEGAKSIIYSENRLGWCYAFFAIWRNRGIAVPVDASSTADDLAYILSDCTPEYMWVSREREAVARQAIEQSGANLEVKILEDYEEAPCDAFDTSQIEPERETTAVIIYTSGTTGSPKGVMLSYRNLFANMAGVHTEVPIYNEDRRSMILLPLHHVLPLQGCLIIPIIVGGGVALCPSLSAPDIMDTLSRGKVAIFIGVPRLWQTLYTGIKKKIDAKFVTRTLFNLCQKAGSRTLSRFVFQSIRKMMGGNIKYFVSGGAALDKEIGEGLRTLGLDVLEGYGMTETAPIIAFTRPDDIRPGCVGLPLPSMQVKLVDGELCAKGPNIMQGYYNRPEETAAVIDKDGFIHTGDLARIDEAGRVYITGRTKEIIVLSNGKNVQPNEIEYKLEKYDQYVKEVGVTQRGDMLCAIIVPQEEWARTLTDAQVEDTLKREVTEPYNRTVENYKKVMSIVVFRGELPRTKLDKLRRFKLGDVIDQVEKGTATTETATTDEANLTPEFRILRDYIEAEKHIQVRPTDHLETDLALDSLDKVGLQGFIEHTFGMKLSADEMASLPNVNAMAERIAQEKTRTEVSDIDWHTILTTDASQLELPHTSPLYPVHAKTFKAFLRLYNRIQINGRENIPAKGPFIVAPNHQSYIDGPIVAAGFDTTTIRQCYFYATENHVRGALLKKMAQRNNVIIMERSNLKDSIMKMAEVLKMGRNIIIFPEGTRSHTGELQEFKKTYAILSRELGVPILPVCVDGAYEALPRGGRFIKPHKISVTYLPPVTPTDNDTYDTLSDKVRTAIANCLSKR